MDFQNVAGVSILAVLAGASWWLLSSVEATRFEPPSKRHAPDAWLIDATTTAMNEFGKPHYRVVSERQDHYRDDGTSEHVRPYVTIYRPEGSPWEVQSDHAWVSADGDLVLLKGDVFMNREPWVDAAGKRHEYQEMVTSNMLLRPNEDYAETDDEVFLTSESSRTDAVGMRAYINIDRVQFLSRVRSRHVSAKDDS
ncbi:MAG: LPS export ABC transporter periplasmic protein LptC [Chromatiales bacterium]|nr:LPS export ABC transporter periplasmic protein LptC [Gammaproteobacteria bacterium]MCP5353087.1 LPS export ABC transporter periplasmic protein LptC [Chromatiales bacterium]